MVLFSVRMLPLLVFVRVSVICSAGVAFCSVFGSVCCVSSVLSLFLGLGPGYWSLPLFLCVRVSAIGSGLVLGLASVFGYVLVSVFVSVVGSGSWFWVSVLGIGLESWSRVLCLGIVFW